MHASVHVCWGHVRVCARTWRGHRYGGVCVWAHGGVCAYECMRVCVVLIISQISRNLRASWKVFVGLVILVRQNEIRVYFKIQ